MTRKSWLFLLGGLVIGLVAAILVVPALLPQYMEKPFDPFNNWGGMGSGMMPYGNNGQVPPNGANNGVAPGGNYNQNPWGGMMGPGMGPNMMGPQVGNANFPASFTTNGQRIYFAASSESGKPISAKMMGMEMVNMQMSCAYCHGAQGQGQTITMQMGTWQTPKISYEYLISDDHGQNNESSNGHGHYTEEKIKRAITEGINPDGKALQWPMPRWNISEEDLNDLLKYLKELPG